MQMRRSRDRDGLDAELQQRVEIVDRRAAEHAGDKIALRGIGIGHADQFDSGKFGKHSGMVGAHDADADNANAQRCALLFTARTMVRKLPQTGRLKALSAS